MTRRVLLVVGLLAAAAVAGLLAGLALAGVRGVCPTEDSTGCVWVGPLQYNHRGNIVINPPVVDVG